MGQRLKLQERFEELLGSENVYFQPPPSVQMQYPCIVYERAPFHVRHADNLPYSIADRYTVTIIDRNPDTELPKKLAGWKFCTINRSFTSDNLNHYVFDLYD